MFDPDEPRYTWRDLVLAWQTGRWHIPAGAAEALDDLRYVRPIPAPALSFEERVAARAARTDGRPDHPGGPVDWVTGEPVKGAST